MIHLFQQRSLSLVGGCAVCLGFLGCADESRDEGVDENGGVAIGGFGGANEPSTGGDTLATAAKGQGGSQGLPDETEIQSAGAGSGVASAGHAATSGGVTNVVGVSGAGSTVNVGGASGSAITGDTPSTAPGTGGGGGSGGTSTTVGGDGSGFAGGGTQAMGGAAGLAMGGAAGQAMGGNSGAATLGGSGGSGGVTSETGGIPGGGANAGTSGGGAGGSSGSGCNDPSNVVDTGADPKFSFFVTSYQQLRALSGSGDGFGGDLRYNGAATGLEGADAICQELACRVGFGQRTWKAFLSTSAVDAIDRIGPGPWYDFAGSLVASDLDGLTSSDRPAGGCCDEGTYDELGIFHDGTADLDGDGLEDHDHDTITASNADGTYAGFSCDDWTSTTAEVPNPEGTTAEVGLMVGLSWPDFVKQSFLAAYRACGCAPRTHSDLRVLTLCGYGAFYCFALPE